jgi:7-keto-8-aminopelargonate synthetase-like enzyme/NADP-dependent 3-hydroxy acid dehydrogenase YdfG/acyl carrier protein
LSALPQTVFPVNDAANAYRFMQQAKHFGKVVLSFNTDTQPAIQPESSYIVTGGLGALGLLVAKQLVEQGAQHLVLAGRGGAVNASGQDLLDSLTAQGVAISIVAADVAKAEDVSRLIEIAQVKFPLRGIIHAAGVIDDAGLEKQTAERFARVMAPKAQGAWHLHKQTQHLQLDFFICFSSISSLMGSPGQCNYSAANAVVDLLMQQRHSQGLPGMSINWGPWAEVGMAANLSFADEGLDKIAPATGMQILADLMRRPAQHSPAQIGVFTINWPLFIKQFPAGQEPLFISKMLVAKTAAMKKSAPSSDIRQQLQNAAPDERPALLNNYIDAQLTQVLSLDASQSTPFDQHWRELGLDSLMTVELKNRLNRSLGVSIPLETIMQDATTRLLAEMVAQRLEDSLASDSFAGASEDRDSGSAEDSYAKNQAALDADVAMLALIPQAYVNVDEQRERQVLIDGRWRCDFASCNYLGMDLHPEVINSIPAALDKWGVHPSWTRAVASPGLYPELEQELADLLGAPETLAYPSIHLLHLGVLPMLAGFNGVILKDNAAHHSIYEACLRAQADGVEWLEFAHNDLADLEKKLARYRPEQSKIIAIDGVYSMSGEFPPLPEMSALAKKYNALIYVDDAHGVGVIGANPTEDMPYGFGGCGIVKYFGLGYEEDRIIYVGGLSKSFSSYGAFITCFDKAMKSRLSLTGPFVFSGPSPVASLASALSGLKVNRREGDQMRRQVYKLTHKLVTSAKAMGFEVDNEHDFPIVGVVIGNIDQVTEACNMLWEYDILITPAIYPAVAMHRNLVRFSITAANTEAEIDQAISGLQAVWDQIVTKQALSA